MKFAEGFAARADLAAPEHRQLFDYWRSISGKSNIPCRSSLQPAAIPRLLPGLLMIDVATPIENSTIRIAGTRLRDVYKSEITGKKISELDALGNTEQWSDIFREIVTTRHPAFGNTRLVKPDGRVMRQYWLRLPMRNKSNAVDIILGYDIFVAELESTIPEKILHIA